MKMSRLQQLRDLGAPLLPLLLPLLLLTGGAVEQIGALRDVRMRVEPVAVESGRAATVLCEYDLEDQQLYSVKFYRGSHEFYRYSAEDEPHTKVFPFPQGLPSSPVNLQRSNQTQVFLSEVTSALAGNLSCEVTTDITFITRLVYTNLVVAVKPEGPPVMTATKPSYDPGDTLLATCTAKPSLPAAKLTFFINEKPVVLGEPVVQNTSLGLMQAVLELRLRLVEDHFSASSRDRDRDALSLRCNAEVPGLAIHNQHLKLSRRTRQPVPARVTYPNSGCPGAYKVPAGTLVIQLLALHCLAR